MDRAAVLAALRARVARHNLAPEAGEIPLAPGLPGIARAAVHEIRATAIGSGTAFSAMVLGRSGGTVLWISDDLLLAPWPPGLAALGLTPDRLVLAQASRPMDALWAMEEALRSPAISGVLLLGGAEPDLSAQRRLQLAAAAGGGVGLILRTEEEPPLAGTASRWRVGGIAGIGGLADPRWSLELLRVRAGRPAGPWAVTWRASSGEIELDEETTAALRQTKAG
ncbi:ImuA family protein [Sabulicella rubraurantiaca]|uniref:ImuA family protein n=1 Tax=Sabulicella rubraurantiaca TaxID=2811429 RepID=UPI001A974478|nr:hypothetical protein [Sabulicella rubraurantiaca]